MDAFNNQHLPERYLSEKWNTLYPENTYVESTEDENEYEDKLKTYSTGLVWGHSLCENFYHANKDFDKFNKEFSDKCDIGFKAYSVFDQNALMERSRLLYEIVKVIWEVS